RKSRLMRSVIAVRFTTEKSQFAIPGPFNTGSVRDSLPNVNAAGCANAARLNQPVIRLCADPSTVTLGLTTFGLDPPPYEFVRFVAVVNASGKPVCRVVTPLNAHPEINLSAAPCTLPSIRFPLPKGKS